MTLAAFPGAQLPGQPFSLCPLRPLRIALAGYGHVGQALAERLATDERYEIASILVRDVNRSRAVAPPCAPTADRDAFASPRADVLVDALSCHRTGTTLALEWLARGAHVVSASKRAISTDYEALAGAARSGAVELRYSAAVGGAAPVLETVAAAKRSGTVESVTAILNGTVNFILDRLSRGANFQAALAEARLAGFAEESPIEDLSGADAAAKLRLIAIEAYGAGVARLTVQAEALDAEVAARIAGSGERWIQVARLARDGGVIEASVSLLEASRVTELPALPDEWNGASVRTVEGRVLRCLGRGAGGGPTAEALLADLGRIRSLGIR